MRKLTVIESPFRGETREITRQNIIYAQLCLLDSLGRGEAPIASHLLYTQVWEEKLDFRRLGIGAGLEWLRVAEGQAFYEDLGISDGMKNAFEKSPLDAWKIEHRVLYVDRGKLSRMSLIPFPELGAILDVSG